MTETDKKTGKVISKEKKTIALYPFEKERHTLYNDDIALLSKKYNLVYNPIKTRRQILPSFKLTKIYFLRWFYHKFIRGFLRVNDIKFLFKPEKKYTYEAEKAEKLPYDLLFSVAKIPPYKNNYIIDFEKIMSLSSFDYNLLDKEYIARKFAEPNCKAILPWYDIAKRSLVETIDCSKFMDKIKVIPFSMKSDKLKKNFNRKNLNLLFVSSTNNPLDFELKGGIIALEVYKVLAKKYKNINFTARAHVPDWVKKKYGNLPRFKLIDHFLPREKLLNLVSEADILLEPIPGTKLMLECMNFAVPAVAFDCWEIPEMIINGKNGFIIDSSFIYGPIKTKEQFQKYLKNHHLNYLKMYKRTWPQEVIDEFAEKTSKLIENKKLRIKMAKYAKSLIEPGGKYNINKRRKALLKVIEASL